MQNRDEKFPLCSGIYSREDEFIRPYIYFLNDFLNNNDIASIVEIGCGDFYIMQKVLNNRDDIIYTGIDVAENVLDYDKREFSSPHVRFVFGDAAAEDFRIPNGDLLIIRTVLQHLSNDDIKAILNKACAFPFVLVTEELYKGKGLIPNIDKPSGYQTRCRIMSGVYLEKRPFSVSNLVHLLVLPTENNTILRTSLMINGKQKQGEEVWNPFSEAEKGRRIWLKIKEEYGISCEDALIIFEKYDEKDAFYTKALEEIPFFMKRKFIKNAYVVSNVSFSMDYEQSFIKSLIMAQSEIYALLKFCRLVQFMPNIIVVSDNPPFANRNLIGYKGIDEGTFIRYAIMGGVRCLRIHFGNIEFKKKYRNTMPLVFLKINA